MPTARSLIEMAHKLLGVIPQGQALEAAEAEDGRLHLNALLEQWRLERLMVLSITRQQFPLLAGQQTYTLGPGGQWNSTRPVTIEQVGFYDSLNDYEMPGGVLGPEAYQRISMKAERSTWPYWIYNDRAMPLSHIFVYPCPEPGAGATPYRAVFVGALGGRAERLDAADAGARVRSSPVVESGAVAGADVRKAGVGGHPAPGRGH